MGVDRGRLNWGVFLIVVGAVPLAYRQDLISGSDLSQAWRLWPLIIVGIGLAIILSRTRAFFVGGLVVAICVGLVLGSVLAVGPNVGCGGVGGSSRSVAQSGAFDGGTSVQLNLQCGTATVASSSDGLWHVDATDSAGSVPSVTSASNRLQVDSFDTNGWSFGRGTDTWQVSLPSNVSIDLSASLNMGDARFNLTSVQLSSARFDLNMGSLHVDLTGAQIGTLNVSTNLGSAYVTLGDTSDLSGRLSTNLGSLDVCVPADLGVSVVSSDSLSSSDFSDAGLVLTGGAWQTPNYLEAAHRASLTVDTSLGSVKFKHAGGCQ